MKKCPKCNSEVDDNFNLCWNCQYSFVEYKVIESNNFILICPNCSRETNPSFDYCPFCQHDLRIDKEVVPSQSGLKRIDCLRCNVLLDFQGNYTFYEESRVGSVSSITDLKFYKGTFDLYCCPRCGKVEFFMPGGE